MNKVLLHGRIPFALNIYNLEDEDKKSYLGFLMNVQRDYVGEEGYRPNDDIYVKAFGPTAEFIHRNFEEGSHIIVEGKLQRDQDTEDEDGNKVKGRMFVVTDRAYFAGGPNGNNGNKKEAEAKSKNGGSTKNKQGLNPIKGEGKKKSLVK